MAEKLSRQVERIKHEIKEYEHAIEVLEKHNQIRTSSDNWDERVGQKPIRTLSDEKRKLERKL